MLIQIDLTSQIPIYQQIRDQIVLGIASGFFEPGELLPTVRQLADDLGINPMTVNKAYSLLKQEGMIVTDRREGTKIKENVEVGGLPQDYQKRLAVILAEGLSKSNNPEEFRKIVNDLISEVGGA